MSSERFSHKNAAEELLVREHLIVKRSPQRQQVLGCIACRWKTAAERGDEPVTYGREIVECTSIASGTVHPLLSRLERAGALVSRREEGDPTTLGRPLRREYVPSDSALGTAFHEALVAPDICSLESARDADLLNKDFLPLTENSTPEELRELIEAATKRLQEFELES